jgi:hypothetical protein
VFHELRQHRIQPGQMATGSRGEPALPVFKGMAISGAFRGEEGASVWVWIRRFESQAERERLYKAIYESEHWKNNIAPKIPAMMDRAGMNVQRVVPTQASVLR